VQNITPFLWFDTQAEAAAKFYVGLFKKNSKILAVSRYSKRSPGPEGSVMTVKFRVQSQEFVALNGGTDFKITPAISFVVNCATQKEVDYYWAKLSAGGKKVQCGWLEDKFGVSWQIVPTELMELLTEKDPAKTERVMMAMLKMIKLDIKTLRRAAGKK